MIGYRDKTFCVARCVNAECSSRLTQAVKDAAAKWWGGPDAPIWKDDYSANCPDYTQATVSYSGEPA